MDREAYLQVYRHSLAHVLAKAVIEIFGRENVQYAIGPQIADGFYYDFVLPRNLTQDDFPMIENKMREILKRKENWSVKEYSRDEARELFRDQKFKTELIDALPADARLTVYSTGDDYQDLCRGPHVENSQDLLGAAFQIKSVSGAYWRGDEKRDSLQRIYVYAFPTKEELKAHLNLIREAQERDHKKLGREQELFMFDETAPGMPYWLPRGWKLYQALLKYSREVQARHGYTEISAPLINNKKLWLISGHWAHYINNMFMVPGISGWLAADAEIPGVLENASEESGEKKAVKIQAGSVLYNRENLDTMAAKPMNCPNAMLTFKRKNRSYKELPIRYSEYDVLHRKEKSGQMNGLFRVQEFRQDDDHTFVAENQIEAEIADIISIADEVYSTFGVSYRAELSTRPDDFMGDIEVWNRAEAALKKILTDKYGEGGFEINEGDGAFYGPKIDLQIKDALGREWQCGTIQLDFQLPHNFGLSYQTADGSTAMPVVIHRAILGSIDRFVAFLLEETKGILPLWLAPRQAVVIPVSPEAHGEYAKKVVEELRKIGVRTELDDRNEKLGYRIREAQTNKLPIEVVVGDGEIENNGITLRRYGSRQETKMSLEEFLAAIKAEIDEKRLAPEVQKA